MGHEVAHERYGGAVVAHQEQDGPVLAPDRGAVPAQPGAPEKGTCSTKRVRTWSATTAVNPAKRTPATTLFILARASSHPAARVSRFSMGLFAERLGGEPVAN